MSTIQRRELARFRNHVKKLAEKDHLGVDGFDAELNQLRQVDQRVRSNLDEFYTGSLGSSLAKNRFDDVKPNEGTIVRLKPVSKNGEGTYINANYIDARETLEVPFVYIATQAPLENTVLDFWRMIYENDVAFIVMLCNTQENGKSKSKMYWPAVGEVIDLKLLSITNVGEKSHQDSVHRTLVLRTIRGDERTITHMQHLGWPDEGVPESSVPLMMMIQEIAKSPRSVTSPIVVHCSGGVGRTGVFISMHVLLGQFQQERTHMSVPRVVHFLKLCRSGMVQRKDQYLYLYYATLREMERMVLSCDTGRDLLTGASVTRQVHSSSLRIDTDTTTGPPVMLLPAKVTSHKKWKLANLFKYGSAEPTDGKEKSKRRGVVAAAARERSGRPVRKAERNPGPTVCRTTLVK
ncbi:protein-tyrosine phosphatase [Angomonas deanei]|uniref:Protein-tyrosine phosphatase, putative n=1 Tax=Angomonas deanei TaxID=59799 RepID=A0A7G2C321_9TRYP|nr:protein-tyrosine phosphatase [Angomonas deanei]CAD2213133.1 Protein-tyrosine phosphatase, putative [Angomonas deanei]|eukprot:EPY38608.1 protein-tyrosine phosphatase [Angomonas deanei]